MPSVFWKTSWSGEHSSSQAEAPGSLCASLAPPAGFPGKQGREQMTFAEAWLYDFVTLCSVNPCGLICQTCLLGAPVVVCTLRVWLGRAWLLHGVHVMLASPPWMFGDKGIRERMLYLSYQPPHLWVRARQVLDYVTLELVWTAAFGQIRIFVATCLPKTNSVSP